MNDTKFLKRNRIFFYHIIFWIAMTIFSYGMAFVQDGNSTYVLDAIGKYIIAAVIFYANSKFVFPYFLQRKQYLLTALGVFSVLILSFGMKVLLYHHLFQYLGFPESPYTYFQSFVMNIWWWIQYTLFALAYWYTLQSSEHEKRKVFFEREKMKAEFAYLRAKVDPHFLYNVLNVFYSKALTFSDELANNIVTLADIMRYSINEEPDGKILLSTEIEQINNVIAINKMRFDEHIHVEFTTKGDFDGVRVIPFMLVTLVENAFKHGEFLTSPNPLIIYIELNESGILQMRVRNRKSKKPNWASYGIGLDNIRNRLELEYKQGGQLSVTEDTDFFLIELIIHV